MKLETVLKILDFRKWTGEINKDTNPKDAKEIIQYTYQKNGKWATDYYVRT